MNRSSQHRPGSFCRVVGPPGAFSQPVVSQVPLVPQHYLLCFDTVPNSLLPPLNLSPVFSINSELSSENTREFRCQRPRPTSQRPCNSAAVFCTFLHGVNHYAASFHRFPRSLQKNTGGVGYLRSDRIVPPCRPDYPATCRSFRSRRRRRQAASPRDWEHGTQNSGHATRHRPQACSSLAALHSPDLQFGSWPTRTKGAQ